MIPALSYSQHVALIKLLEHVLPLNKDEQLYRSDEKIVTGVAIKRTMVMNSTLESRMMLGGEDCINLFELLKNLKS